MVIMSYRHFGRFGDVWKHLPLAEFLWIERPTRFVDTNAAFPQYALSGSAEQAYGVGVVERNIDRSAAIRTSQWWRLLTGVEGNAERITTYLGSPALAMRLLADLECDFEFFDLERDALDKVRRYAQHLALSGRVRCRNEDSIEGLMQLAETLPPSSFVHVDPYDVHAKNVNGQSYFEAFCRVVRAGVQCMLWYGFNTPRQREESHEAFGAVESSGLPVVGIEMVAAPFGPDPPVVDPGILGCGVLGANLGEASVSVFRTYASELVSVYRGSRMMGQHCGEVSSREFVLRV
jgi:23S rRNA (adenine2030-N6)-methyltransferase